MEGIMDSIVRNNVSVGDVKCRTSLVDSDPGGEIKELHGSKYNKELQADIEQEQLERKKRTRRRKAKRKNPYSKQISENRGKKNIRLRGNKTTLYEQPVAPYNSNQFLIEDHNDLQDFDVKLMAATVNKPGDQNGSEIPARTGGRIRDSSFTSADSDDDFFYSSPEDEEEFLTKEFSNAYQDLHVESLTSMSKAELIQQVLHLEEKVDMLQKRLGSKIMDEGEGDKNRSDISDKAKYFQAEISKLVMANEELKFENAKLREQNSRRLSESSEDSESDSSTSSDSSQVSMEQEINEEPYKHMNGDVHPENVINMDPTDNT